ncbi:HEAT repeat domain-containing protein [Acidovorax radicis]|uniref:HEAT repeat domain-containing protein n=1 Tax=Acidovorax radicis TaxID=758826 RepID=UPI0009DB332A|nr:HEAT repeat domain-containing protein [Acidovorax radicis]
MALHPAAARLESVTQQRLNDEIYFCRLGIPYEPESLLKVLRERKPKTAVPAACHGLANLGAKEAIPELRALADFSHADTKATSVLAVARLGGSQATPWLMECLSQKGTDKGYVLWALAAVGDPSAYEAVRQWFTPILKKLEKDPGSDKRGKSIFAIAYLEQVTDAHPDASTLLERFHAVVPSLGPSIRTQLAQFTRSYARSTTNQT